MNYLSNNFNLNFNLKSSLQTNKLIIFSILLLNKIKAKHSAFITQNPSQIFKNLLLSRTNKITIYNNILSNSINLKSIFNMMFYTLRTEIRNCYDDIFDHYGWEKYGGVKINKNAERVGPELGIEEFCNFPLKF